MIPIKKILVIAPFYYWFVKGLTEAESKYVEEINVLIHHNRIAEVSKYVPFGGYFERIRQFYTKDKLINSSDIYDNIKTHLIPMNYLVPDGLNASIGDKIARKFERYIIKNQIEFDIIHAHFSYPQGYAAAKLAKRFNVPVVTTLHEPKEYFELCHHLEKNEWAWLNADALIRVNKKDIPMYLNVGVKKDNIFSIPNGYTHEVIFPINKDIAREKLGLDKNVKILLNIARLSPEKNQKDLIEAMNIIINKRSDVICLIGGSGQIEEQLQSQIKKLKIDAHVKIVGYIPDDLFNYYLNAADVFVLPSLREANPTVMFEALGCGKPFIGTMIGGIPEIITSEDYGLLCEPGNPKDLAEKILVALDKKWDEEVIRKYAERFTWEKIAKETIEVYEQTLKT